MSAKALKSLTTVIESHHHQGDGPFTEAAAKILSSIVGGGVALLTTSCTHALEMASMLIELGPGDEVIIPSFNFTSAATSVTKFGAIPVFVDIDQRNKCIDVELVRNAISERTKAISWVNYAGYAPDIESIQKLSQEFNILLIEDNAHGLGGTYKGRPLGSFGDFATQSFHATKNIQCGEGGALIVNNPKYLDRAEIIREKGTNRKNFSRGLVDKYQWVDQGSSYLLADILAAILYAQLTDFLEIQKKREAISLQYFEEINEKFEEKDIFKMRRNTEGLDSFHMFFIEFPNKNIREQVIKKMKVSGVQVTSHYQPLHSSPFGSNFPSSKIGTFVQTNRFAESILRLPIYPSLDADSLDHILDSLQNAVKEI